MRIEDWSLRRLCLTLAAVCGTAVLLLYLIRPIGLIHGTAMFLYTHPLIWKLPLLTGVLTFAISGLLPYVLVRRKQIASAVAHLKQLEDSDDNYSNDPRPWDTKRKAADRVRQLKRWYRRPATISAVIVFGALVFACCTVGMFTGRAIYQHYQFTDIGKLPANGQARILPKQVAEQLATSGYNSPTSRLAQAHIVRDADGDISWTFGEVPNGTWRKYTAKTQGVATLNAESTSRNLELAKQDFEISTNVRWTDDLKWRAYKKHFFTDVAETVYVVTASGEPVIVAPYLKYVGFWVKVPELAGVYVVHADGTMEDLSPEEAERRPFIVNSGRMFPEKLARRIQESYQYKGGILNRMLTHRDQTQIADTSSNNQPYLMDFGDEGTKWVSTAKPYGRAQATNAIFLTDTITGETDIWHVPDGDAYTGNSKALDIVRALSMPGITFASLAAEDAAGKFEAIEPRPVIVDGRLRFMISVVPTSETTVTKTVIVDAKSNRAVAVFNHDTDPEADRKLKSYLQDGTPPETEAATTGGSPRERAVAGSRSSGAHGATAIGVGGSSDVDAQLQAALEKLLESNRAQQEAILELKRRLRSAHP